MYIYSAKIFHTCFGAHHYLAIQSIVSYSICNVYCIQCGVKLSRNKKGVLLIISLAHKLFQYFTCRPLNIWVVTWMSTLASLSYFLLSWLDLRTWKARSTFQEVFMFNQIINRTRADKRTRWETVRWLTIIFRDNLFSCCSGLASFSKTCHSTSQTMT